MEQTALHLVAWDKKINKAKLPLEHGARTTVKDADGFNPVDRARLRGQQETKDFTCTAERTFQISSKMAARGIVREVAALGIRSSW
jgi:hypothetical protein